MKENSEKEEQKEKEDNTYSREGMCYGVAAGAVIGAIVIAISNVTYYLPLCVCTGMIIGLAIGSSIKKEKVIQITSYRDVYNIFVLCTK